MHAINIPNSAMISNTYDGQQIQIVNTNGTTIGKSKNQTYSSQREFTKL